MKTVQDKDKSTRRAVLYLRVASADQHDQSYGIAQQRAVCTREADRHGVVITDEYVDTGVSGNTTNRNGLQRLLRRIVERPVKYVIVRDRARLARNQVDDAAITEHLKQSGVTLVSVSNEVTESA
jgi:site-specific DNA recombinase